MRIVIQESFEIRMKSISKSLHKILKALIGVETTIDSFRILPIIYTNKVYIKNINKNKRGTKIGKNV